VSSPLKKIQAETKKSPENNFKAFKLKYEKYQIDILNLQKRIELS